MDEKIKDLNLLLIYLAAWEEDSRKAPGQKILRSWKGYPFEILNELEDMDMISQNRRSKSVVLTEAGKCRAEKIRSRYFSF